MERLRWTPRWGLGSALLLVGFLVCAALALFGADGGIVGGAAIVTMVVAFVAPAIIFTSVDASN